MAWTVEFTDLMEKKLDKLDDETRKRIIRYFRQRVVEHPDPSQLAEPLKGEFASLWRFRIGDYRVICEIQKRNLLVLALDLGHRSKVYK
jgi:mRNA interferase RelE/StbE